MKELIKAYKEYEANDGRMFSSEDECAMYENDIWVKENAKKVKLNNITFYFINNQETLARVCQYVIAHGENAYAAYGFKDSSDFNYLIGHYTHFWYEPDDYSSVEDCLCGMTLERTIEKKQSIIKELSAEVKELENFLQNK